ncbi:AMP-binding protein [Nocardioides sp. AE5]|uniref:AMP-binding protein n=1 Tax=Nocardioides sp. AE5 TaxID=2962573 RepID=UPI002881A18A|nr:AMP-binding protein [Nocardioides sp. AE5]MDT0201118.1 hypothetical protein [Nocardioides sp. AE5]
MPLAWFRTPSGEEPGSLNLAYNAVDLPVIRGQAEEPALIGDEPMDRAGLLEVSAALAGALKALGTAPGTRVGVALADPVRELLVFLAVARLGAVHVDLTPDPVARLAEHAPHVVVTDRPLDLAGHAPAAVVTLDIDAVDGPREEARDLDWETALRAGRTDPAGCEPVAPGTTAYVLEAAVVLGDELADDRFGAMIADLAAGRPVDPAGKMGR